jgi:hypothetical protein
MSKMPKSIPSPQGSQPLQLQLQSQFQPHHPHASLPAASDPGAARQTALLAILGMFIVLFLLNAVSYSINALNTRLSSITSTSTSKFLESPPPGLSTQEWERGVAFRSAPATIKLWFAANVAVLAASCLALVNACIIWTTRLALVSVAARNYAIAYGLGAGICGSIMFTQIISPSRLAEGEEAFLMLINSVSLPVLAGLAFGTME